MSKGNDSNTGGPYVIPAEPHFYDCGAIYGWPDGSFVTCDLPKLHAGPHYDSNASEAWEAKA